MDFLIYFANNARSVFANFFMLINFSMLELQRDPRVHSLNPYYVTVASILDFSLHLTSSMFVKDFDWMGMFSRFFKEKHQAA